MWMAFVARGFIPDGGRSRPKTIECIVSDAMRTQIQGRFAAHRG